MIALCWNNDCKKYVCECVPDLGLEMHQMKLQVDAYNCNECNAVYCGDHASKTNGIYVCDNCGNELKEEEPVQGFDF